MSWNLIEPVTPDWQLHTLETYLDGTRSREKNTNTKSFENHHFLPRNLLIWGDCLYVLGALQKQFKGKIQLIYIDPPFYAGANEIIDVPIGIAGKSGRKGKIVQKPVTTIQDVAYENIWQESNPQSFCQWFYDRIRLMYPLLKQSGFLVVRFDYHYGHYAKVVLDEVFSESNFLVEFLVRRMKKAVSKRNIQNQTHLIVQTDSLFAYRRSSKSECYCTPQKTCRKNADPIEHRYSLDNIWLDICGYEKTKKTLYPTENSIKLLKRVINLYSKEGDIVADFFAGSGTTVAVAQELDRKWIGVDISHYSINEMRKRLLVISENNPKSFQLLRIGPEKSPQSDSKCNFDNIARLELEKEIDPIRREIRLELKKYHPKSHHDKFEELISDFESIDFIDFWAVDWTFKDQDLFCPDFYSFRKIGPGRKIIEGITSEACHRYENPGKYTIAVRALDILGNPATEILEVAFI